MEWIKSEILTSQIIDIKDLESCQFSSCPIHHISFALDDQNKIVGFNDKISDSIQLPSSILQIVNTCTRESDQCHFYFRTLLNKVYLWDATSSSQDHPRKRAKLSDSAEQYKTTPLKEIANDIKHMLFHQDALILFSCSGKVQQLDAQTQQISDGAHGFGLEDSNIMHTQPIYQPLDAGLVDFFSLGSNNAGFLFSTENGRIYWRNNATKQDIKLEQFEGSEQVKKIDIACVPELSDKLNALLFFGDQGTIKLYVKASSEDADISFKQFNIDEPFFSIIKTEDLHYIVSSGLGKISLLKFNYTRKNSIELDTTPMQGITKAHHLISSNQHILDALILNAKDKTTMLQIQYNPLPISIENDQEALKQCIEASLQELAQSESIIQSMDIKEQELNQKLASTNRTLYALSSINHKRQIGICNSLSQTGFEFSVRPITQSNSYENCTLNTTAHLRISIKTGRFLELEHWYLTLHLEPTAGSGQIKTIPVIGFESHYDNGIERYIIWERDIEIDVCLLPLTMSATMMMDLEKGSAAPFPVCKMVLDDLHFAGPCSENLSQAIERRGLEEISGRLMQSYEQQMMCDRSGRYPFARLKLKQQQQQNKPLFSSFSNVHILYSVDTSMTDEQYRSILAIVLGEGHTEQDMQHILRGGAEQALFNLAAYPASPVLIKLSRESPTLIDLNVQCAYAPALFKIEATLLQRVHQYFMDNGVADKHAAFLKKLKAVEDQVYQIQEIYQKQPSEQDDMMDIDENDKSLDLKSQLKKAIDLFYSIHKETPIGHLVFPET